MVRCIMTPWDAFWEQSIFLCLMKRWRCSLRMCQRRLKTQEIVNNMASLSLERDVLLPIFQLPHDFIDANDYQCTHKIWSHFWNHRTVDKLWVICNKKGGGRSRLRFCSCGSIIACCIGITEVDPLHYNLLFERFLNPERVSMPDIDFYFDDEGRKNEFN